MREQTVHCPEFPQGFTWLNTRRPLRVREDLRGQVVVLAVAGGRLFIADTNNHRVLRADPGTGELTPLPIGR